VSIIRKTVYKAYAPAGMKKNKIIVFLECPKTFKNEGFGPPQAKNFGGWVVKL